jgi:hypothetical protein
MEKEQLAMEERSGVSSDTGTNTFPAREQDAIYQNGKIVARVAEPEVDLDSKEVRFGEIYDSDHLLIPEECEFQNYRIIIQRIVFATKIDTRAGRQGRVLRGCVADILGYRHE